MGDELSFDSQAQALATMMEEAVALTGILGLKIVELGKGCVAVRCGTEPVHRNHVNYIHAAVLYSAAEFAGGCSIAFGLVGQFDKVFFVLKEATIQYLSGAKNPAIAKGDLPAETIDGYIELVLGGEPAEITVPVRITDEITEREVGACEFTYSLRPRR